MADAPEEDAGSPPPPPDAPRFFHEATGRNGTGRPGPKSLAEGARLLDRFVVQQFLDHGTFGEVYAVLDTTTESEYALKRLPLDLMWGDHALAIRSNFKLVSAFDHPHIATTRFLEIDRQAGELYAITELVRGPTLTEWVEARAKNRRRSELSHDLAFGLCEQVAEALDYAHSQPVLDRRGGVTGTGILHRELKPGNIMLERDRPFRPGVPFVKVVDFGLSAEIRAGVQDLPPDDRGTGPDATRPYAAPEQREGRTLTPATDQWALAVVLYELLAGTRPFCASSADAFTEQIREGKPEKPPRISDGQWVVLRKAFSPEGRDRYDNCMTMVRAFALADTATSEMLRTKPFVRMVSMRQPSGAQNAATPAESSQPAVLGETAPADGRRVHPLLLLSIIALLGVACGILIWFIFFREGPPVPEAPTPTPTKDQPERIEETIGKKTCHAHGILASCILDEGL